MTRWGTLPYSLVYIVFGYRPKLPNYNLYSELTVVNIKHMYRAHYAYSERMVVGKQNLISLFIVLLFLCSN